MTRCPVLVLFLLPACGESSTPAADAAIEADAWTTLACLGDPAPASAPDPLALHGKVFAVVDYEVAPVEAAPVELHRRGDDALLDTATTDAEGAFELTVATDGTALDAYFVVTTAGRVPTYAYASAPLTGDDDALLLVADAAELGAWYDAAGETYDPSDRTIVAAAVDCAHDTLDGATVAIAPAPRALVYYDVDAKRWDTALDASTNGFALIAGAPASTTLTAGAGGATLPPLTVAPAAGALTLVVMEPRS